MTNNPENSISSVFGSLIGLNEQVLVVIILLNFIFSVLCLLKCAQILSYIRRNRNEDLSQSSSNLHSSLVSTELTKLDVTPSETYNSDMLLIDKAIISIRAGFTQSQISEKLDIEDDYLDILHRTYYKKSG